MLIETLSSDPELLLIHGFVSGIEANDLVAESIGRFSRSTTICDNPDGCAVPDRTSASALLRPSVVTAGIKTRGMAFARAPESEEIQVVRYFPGEEFKPHLDAFDDSEGGTRARAAYGGKQRDATILIYLRSPEEGGETLFPELGLTIPSTPRAALFWRNVRSDGTIDARLLHGGAPVRRGVKYAANLWLRGTGDEPLRDWASGNVKRAS